MPPNTPALASLVGAAFSQTTDTYFFTTRWDQGDERLFWRVGEAKTNPNDGTETWSIPYPFPLTGSPYFTTKIEAATLTLLDGLYVHTPTSWSRTLADESTQNGPIDDPALPVVYAAGSTGEVNSKIITGCIKQGSDVRQGEFPCQPALVEDGQFFTSLSRSPIEAKALEFTASAQTIAFDQKEFVGKTFYDLYFDGSDIDRVAVTLNDDAAKSISVVGSGISAASLTYEFTDYGLKVSGTLTEDGETETATAFVMLRKRYAADEVYTVCWKDEEDAVSTESHAVYACANDPAFERMQNVNTFSKDKADALVKAGKFTPSS